MDDCKRILHRLSSKTKIEKITANPLPPKQNGITVEEAKKIAEQFLAIDSDKVKLRIESIHEMENYNGQTVIMFNICTSMRIVDLDQV